MWAQLLPLFASCSSKAAAWHKDVVLTNSAQCSSARLQIFCKKGHVWCMQDDINCYKNAVSKLLFSRYSTYACEEDPSYLTDLASRFLSQANIEAADVGKVHSLTLKVGSI